LSTTDTVRHPHEGEGEGRSGGVPFTPQPPCSSEFRGSGGRMEEDFKKSPLKGNIFTLFLGNMHNKSDICTLGNAY
jgi:hypothetical protein